MLNVAVVSMHFSFVITLIFKVWKIAVFKKIKLTFSPLQRNYEIIFMEINMMFKIKRHYIQTVSYTHLDVYKRQGQRMEDCC